MVVKQTDKFTDDDGRMMWVFDNNWRIRRSLEKCDGTYFYAVESVKDYGTYEYAGEFTSLAEARKIVTDPDGPTSRNFDAEMESSRLVETMDGFTRSYLIAALFTGIELPSGHPDGDSDKCYDPEKDLVSVETLNEMIADCAKFQEQASDIIQAAAETGEVRYGPDCSDEFERAGHDFWMTRCGHGVGFWDGDWPEPMAKQLTDLAHKFGNVDLYFGDDARIYGM